MVLNSDLGWRVGVAGLIALAVVAAACGSGSTGGGGSSPAPLPQTFRGPNNCVVVHYPTGWGSEDYGNLAGGHTGRCPGGGDTTAVVDTCDSNHLNGGTTAILQLYGQTVIAGDNWPQLFINIEDGRCQNLDEQLRVVRSRLKGGQLSPVYSQRISGVDARCFEAKGFTGAAQGGAFSALVCYLPILGNLYSVNAVTPASDWQQDAPLLRAIVSRIELHPLSR